MRCDATTGCGWDDDFSSCDLMRCADGCLSGTGSGDELTALLRSWGEKWGVVDTSVVRPGWRGTTWTGMFEWWLVQLL
jgi:hypothetical protein